MSKPDTTPATKHSLPLNSIRVFVEAARQRSFSRAASVLGMTQGGVSRHVATLEKHLGHPLFVRTGGTVEVTEVGRLYFDNVQEAMSAIELTTRQLQHRPHRQGRLLVRTSLPTLAVTVIIPALSRFSPEPAVQVDVVTSLSPPDPGDRFDVLVSRDLEVPHAEHWLLCTEDLVCVAAPALQHQFAGRPVHEWPLITSTSRPDTLPAWIQQQQGLLPPHTLQMVGSFEHYFLAIPAAIGGMGFLVVPRVLAAEHLRHGHLVQAPTPTVRGSARYTAYLNPKAKEPEAARAFCRWLKGLLREDIRI